MKSEREITQEDTVYITDTGDVDVEERKLFLKRCLTRTKT